MKRIGVLTSGGDAPGMNAAIRAVIRTSIQNNMSVVGFKRGYNGLLMQSLRDEDDFALMTERSVSGTMHRGGTFLMTARCKAFLKEESQRHAVKNLNKLGVEGLICLGGNGTFSGAAALHRLDVPVVGVPCTIDNDLEYTDYTIGFDTALNTACGCIDRIRESGYSHERASLVTVMGRDCGDIAVHTALACGAEIVLTPEIPWSIEAVAEEIKLGVIHGKHSMIIIFAEGALRSLTTDVAAVCARNPALAQISVNHLTSSQIALMIEVLSGHETRATVLGYTQRGGSPSAFDRILASKLGHRAVELLRDDCGGRAVGSKNGDIIDVPIGEACQGQNGINTALIDLISDLA